MLPPVLLVPKLSEGADRVGGQLRGDNGAFSGVIILAEFGGRCRKVMLGVWSLMSAPVITI